MPGAMNYPSTAMRRRSPYSPYSTPAVMPARKIKAPGELDSAAAMQNWRARNALYGDIPTAESIIEQQKLAKAQRDMANVSALSKSYEAMRRAQGAGAPPPADPADPSAKRRANLIAGGAQPMEADKILADEAKANVGLAKPVNPQVTGLGPSGVPLATAPAPAIAPSNIPSPTGSTVLSAAMAAIAKPAAPAPPPTGSTITDGNTTTPMKTWIEDNKKRQQDEGIGTGSGQPVGAAARGGRHDKSATVLAGEAGPEVKLNDDGTAEAINLPTMLSRKQGGAIVPNHELKRLKKKYDKKPIKKDAAAAGGRLTSADGLIGNANAFAPAGIGGSINLPGPTPSQVSTNTQMVETRGGSSPLDRAAMLMRRMPHYP